MKIRLGFVSNSSSSCFICGEFNCGEDETEGICADCTEKGFVKTSEGIESITEERLLLKFCLKKLKMTKKEALKKMNKITRILGR